LVSGQIDFATPLLKERKFTSRRWHNRQQSSPSAPAANAVNVSTTRRLNLDQAAFTFGNHPNNPQHPLGKVNGVGLTQKFLRFGFTD
jgi:hypothetical protein